MSDGMREPAKLPRARATFRSGPYLPRRARREAVRPLLVVTDHDAAALAELVDHLLELQLHHPVIKPVLLTGQVDAPALRRAGFVYETCFEPTDLSSLGVALRWADYRSDRIQTMVDVYGPAVVRQLDPGELPTLDALTDPSG